MARRRSRLHRDVDHADLVGLRTRAYLRESTKKQTAADRNGPTVQRASIAGYIEKYGLATLDFEYFDAASGRSTKRRPELQRALRDAEAGAYDILLCYNTSRSFRNPGDADAWKARFKAAGVTFVFTDPEIISGNRRTRFQERFLQLNDEEQVERHSVNVTDGLRQKFLQRRMHNGTAPLGYTRYAGPPGDPQNGLLQPDDHAETVQILFREYGSGRYSMPSLVRHLNAQRQHDGCCGGRDPNCAGERRYTNRRSEPLTKALIAELLRNPVYLGKIVFHPGTPEEQIIDGQHEPLVTQAEWELATRVRESNHRFRGRQQHESRIYPLTPRARCHLCGASFRGDTSGGRRRMRHAEDRVCTNRRSFMANKLEVQFGEVLDVHLSLPNDWETAILRELAQHDPADRAAERTRLTRALERLRDLYVWEDVDRATYHERKATIEAELASLQIAEPAFLPDLRRAAHLLADLPGMWNHHGLSDATRRDLVEEVFDSIMIDEVGIREVRPHPTYAALAAAAPPVDVASGRGERI